jgi:hypothetical protein
MLPAKRVLAEEYRMIGNRTDVCAHNSRVAARAGNSDLAHVWALVKLLLQNQLPSVAVRDYDIITIAHQATDDVKRKDGKPSLTQSRTRKLPRPGPVKWGENPLGGRWLIPAL